MHLIKAFLAFTAVTTVLAAPALSDDSLSLALGASIEAGDSVEVDAILEKRRSNGMNGRSFLDTLYNLSKSKLDQSTSSLLATANQLMSKSTSVKAQSLGTLELEAAGVGAAATITNSIGIAAGKGGLTQSQIASIKKAVTTANNLLSSIDQSKLSSNQRIQFKNLLSILQKIAKAFGFTLTTNTTSTSSSSTNYPMTTHMPIPVSTTSTFTPTSSFLYTSSYTSSPTSTLTLSTISSSISSSIYTSSASSPSLTTFSTMTTSPTDTASTTISSSPQATTSDLSPQTTDTASASTSDSSSPTQTTDDSSTPTMSASASQSTDDSSQTTSTDPSQAT